MATPIIMPKFGQMTEESAIVEWLKKEGDKVAKGDILFTVETDKSVMEVESFEAGTLLKIVVQAGRQRSRAKHRRFSRPTRRSYSRRDRACARRAETGRHRAGSRGPQRAGDAVPDRITSDCGRRSDDGTPVPAPAPAPSAPALFRISPRAAALAKRSVIDPNAITGSGPQAASSRRT